MTLTEFRAEVDRVLPDNDQGLITAEVMRALFKLIAQLMAEGVDE